MNKRYWVLALLIVLAGAWTLVESARRQADGLAPFSLDRRPQQARYLFDYAGVLEHYEEGAANYLQRLAQQFHIEALIVSLPDLGPAASIEQLAVDIVNRWQIGRGFEGRGLLLLLVDKQKQVKLEVAYQLEDVFTDAFSGYAEDLQLRPYFLRSDLGTGLIAVMEELERRAQIKQQDDYTAGLIARLDRELLAGGAGAKRRLARYRADRTRQSDAGSPAGTAKGAATPEQGWRIMLAKWVGEGAGIDADIYTELTKMAMGDPDKPDPRTRAALEHWRNARYRVLQDGDHAVIYFGNRKGWNNAPFLFCRTRRGWQFDIVHQRRLIVMGSGENWMVEQGNYPYVSLLGETRQSTGKDLPLSEADRYRCAEDEAIAANIRRLEKSYRADPADKQALLGLIRLNVITGRRPNHVHPLIKRAKQLDPVSAEPYKYAAIYNVNTFFQYQTALAEILTYIDRRGEDAFGYQFLGFVYYRLGEYRKSIDALETALRISADNAYAYALLARDYALLYKHAAALDSRRPGYKNAALAMLRKAERAVPPDTHRIARLKSWLKRRKIL